MKYVISVLFSCLVLLAVAQDTFADYLEMGEATSVEEMANMAMKPAYASEIKSNMNLIEDFVNKAGWDFENLSAADLTAWNACMKYLVDLGVSLNGKNDEDGYNSLMHFTSSLHLGYGNDSLSNDHLLHTGLLALGGKTEIIVDDTSLLQYVLTSSTVSNELYDIYLNDFKKWDEARKAKWLFSVVSIEDSYETDEVEMLEQLLEQKAFDVNIRSKNGKESLFDAAIRSGKFFTANMLVNNGFNVNQRCFACDGQTALHNLINNGDYCEDDRTYDLLMKMLEKGGDADLRDMKGLTPVHYAIKLKCEMAFKVFMEEEDVTFNFQLGTLKGRSYYTYFVDEWGDQDYLEMLMTKTELKAPLTKKDIKESKKKKKEEAAQKKDADKEKKKGN